jgi:hypothetical protein
MNCQEVNKLSFLYCDDEVQSHVRKELEEHLQQCADCQRLIQFTRCEREALGFDEDLPDLSPDFSHRVVQAINVRDRYQPTSPRSFFYRLFSRYNLNSAAITGTAMLLILFLMLTPGLRTYFNKTYVPAPTEKQNKAKISKADTSNKADTPSVNSVTDDNAINSEINQKAFQPEAAPVPSNGSITKSEQVKTPRRSGTFGELSHGEAGTAGISALFQPSYLPPGFTLTRAENDADNNITLVFEDEHGGIVSLKIQATGGDYAYPPNQNAVSLGSSDHQAQKSISSPDLYATGNAPSQPLSWKVSEGDKIYQLELSGNVGSEELNKIAASLKPEGGNP